MPCNSALQCGGASAGFSHDPLCGSFASHFTHFRRLHRDPAIPSEGICCGSLASSLPLSIFARIFSVRCFLAANDAAASSCADDSNGNLPGKNGTYAIPCAASSSMTASSPLVGLPVDLRRYRPGYELSRYVEAGLRPLVVGALGENLIACLSLGLVVGAIRIWSYEDRISK
jgi:hypothetical protein